MTEKEGGITAVPEGIRVIIMKTMQNGYKTVHPRPETAGEFYVLSITKQHSRFGSYASGTFKMCPGRIAQFGGNSRTAMGHVQKVAYITSISV